MKVTTALYAPTLYYHIKAHVRIEVKPNCGIVQPANGVVQVDPIQVKGVPFVHLTRGQTLSGRAGAEGVPKATNCDEFTTYS